MEPTTLIHFVVFTSKRDPVIAENMLEGVQPNERRGAVVPVKAESGDQDFACPLNMKKYAGKLYEGGFHHATGDPQFVNCPDCKDTKAFKEAMAEHERHTLHDRGIYSGIFNKQGTGMQGRAQGTVGGSGVPGRPPENPAPPQVLPASPLEGAEAASDA